MTTSGSLRAAIAQLGLDGLRPQGGRKVLGAAPAKTFRALVAEGDAARELPSRMQFRLRGFVERDSTDDFIQGGDDEVYMSAVSTDSAAVTLGPGGQPVPTVTTTGSIGDVSDDAVRGPWAADPFPLVEFDLRRRGAWPRTFVVTLLFVEHDDGDLAQTFREVEATVGDTVKAAVATAASAGAAALAGAAIGSIVPGIGTAIGAAAGALSAVLYDDLVNVIEGGLGDEVFNPLPVALTVDRPSLVRQHPAIGSPQDLRIQQHDADYGLQCDWWLVP